MHPVGNAEEIAKGPHVKIEQNQEKKADFNSFGIFNSQNQNSLIFFPLVPLSLWVLTCKGTLISPQKFDNEVSKANVWFLYVTCILFLTWM